MAIHVIPVTEPDLHQESPDCQCEPKFILDPESGEMVWAHQLQDADGLLDDLMQF